MKLYSSQVLNEQVALLYDNETYDGPYVSYTRTEQYALSPLKGQDDSLRFIHQVKKLFGGTIFSVKRQRS